MKTIWRIAGTVLSVATLSLAACGQAAPASPVAAPATPPASSAQASGPAPASAKPVASNAQSSSARSSSAKPAAPGAADTAAKPGPADDWNAVTAAAKHEGKLTMIGPQGSDLQDIFTKPFQKLYPDIQVEYQPVPGGQVTPKVTAEQGAGKFQNDLVVVGPGTIMSALVPAKALTPIEPWLTGPSTRDTSMWRGGAMEIVDPSSRTDIIFSNYAQLAFIYNPTQVNPADFKSWKDLLNPKWQGKMVISNPRASSAGSVAVVTWYQTPALGQQYMRDMLVGQKMTVLSDDQQAVDGVGHGTYPISIVPSNTLIAQAIRNNLPVKPFDGNLMAEGTHLSPGNATTAVFRNPPHPNVTKLYLDWLLSRDGQYAWSQVQNLPSLRGDVPADHVPEYYRLKSGVTYYRGYGEDFDRKSKEAVAYLDMILPR